MLPAQRWHSLAEAPKKLSMGQKRNRRVECIFVSAKVAVFHLPPSGLPPSSSYHQVLHEQRQNRTAAHLRGLPAHRQHGGRPGTKVGTWRVACQFDLTPRSE